MADFKYTLEFNSTATGSGAEETVRSLDRVSTASKGAGQSTQSLTSGLTKMQKPTRDNAQALLMFSQGVEDAQYGIRGVLNNIPSLVMALGGGAGLAGAISLGAVAFSGLIEMMSNTDKKADETGDKIDALKTRISNIVGTQIDDAKARIDLTADSAETLRQKFVETGKAEETFQKDLLTRAEKLATAQRNIAEALGLQVDVFAQLDEQAKQAEAKRKQAADEAIDRERKRQIEAEDKLNKQIIAARGYERLAESISGKLTTAESKLNELRQRESELSVISKEGLLPTGPNGQGLIATPGAKAAQAELPDITNAIALQAEKVATLRAELLAFEKADIGILDKSARQIAEFSAKFEDTSKAVERNIETIKANFDSDQTVAKSEELVEQGKVLATGLKDALGKVQTTNDTGKQAVDGLVKAAEDGKITLEEQGKFATDLRTLIGQIQSGQATYSGTLTELRALQGRGQELHSAQQAELAKLKSGMGNLETQMGNLKNQMMQRNGS